MSCIVNAGEAQVREYRARLTNAKCRKSTLLCQGHPSVVIHLFFIFTLLRRVPFHSAHDH